MIGDRRQLLVAERAEKQKELFAKIQAGDRMLYPIFKMISSGLTSMTVPSTTSPFLIVLKDSSNICSKVNSDIILNLLNYLTTMVSVGDAMTAKVLKVNDGEGQVLLTYKRLAAEKGNERLKEAYENHEVLKAPKSVTFLTVPSILSPT